MLTVGCLRWINVSKTQKKQPILFDRCFVLFVSRITYRLLIKTNNIFECFKVFDYVSVGPPIKPKRTTYFFKRWTKM